MSVFARTVKNNIWKLYTISALRGFMLIMPVIVLFYKENGLSMAEVLLLQALFSVVIVVLEIPSGYFADLIGRRISIIFGGIGGFLGYLIYAGSYGFWGFLVAEIFLAVGASFMSGADSALLYDSLAEIGKKDDYKKYEGRFGSISNFSEAVASIIGGALAVISLRTPLYYESIALFLSVPLSFTLVETARQAINISESKIKSLAKIIKFSLHEHKEIKWLIIYGGIISSATLTMVWFIQPYFVLVGLPLVWFGLAWAALMTSSGVFSYVAHAVEDFFGRKKSLISLLILTIVAYWLLATWQAWWGIGVIFIFYFVWGISRPILLDYVNRLVPADIRATVLSVKSFVARLIFAIVGPFIGWASDTYSLSMAFILSGLTFLVLGGISLLLLNRHKVL